MVITIEFETDTVAFEDVDETGIVIRSIARQIDEGLRHNSIKDSDGNIIGNYSFERCGKAVKISRINELLEQLKSTKKKKEIDCPFRDGIMRDFDECKPDFGCNKLAKTKPGDRFVCWMEVS